MKESGIYQIQSKCNSKKIYIGSSIDITKRWKQHMYNLKKGNHANIKLQNHVNKYGIEDLMFSKIVGCDENCLISFEQFYIDCLCPFFNVRIIADRNTGMSASNETKEKMSLSHKGTKRSEEVKKRMSEAQKGNNHKLGKKQSEETKHKIGESQKGEKNHMYKKDPWNKGKKGIYTLETIAKMSKPKTQEHINNMSIALKGHTPWNKGLRKEKV